MTYPIPWKDLFGKLKVKKKIPEIAEVETILGPYFRLDSKCDWCVLDKVLKGDNFEKNIKSPLDDRQYRISNMPEISWRWNC